MIGQTLKMSGNIGGSRFVQQFQTLLKTVKKRRCTGSALPCQGGRFERLLAVLEIPRCLDADPADERWLYTRPCAVRKIHQSAAFRRAEPFVAGTARRVDELGRQVIRHRSKPLDNIYTK